MTVSSRPRTTSSRSATRRTSSSSPTTTTAEAYELGTAYGHVAIGVDDLDGTLGALKDEHGIEPERPPYQVGDGGSRICFVRDPDDYRVELIERRG